MLTLTYSPMVTFWRFVQIKYTPIRQLPQELSDQGILTLLKHEFKLNIFLGAYMYTNYAGGLIYFAILATL